jgi:hypothetical protein
MGGTPMPPRRALRPSAALRTGPCTPLLPPGEFTVVLSIVGHTSIAVVEATVIKEAELLRMVEGLYR